MNIQSYLMPVVVACSLLQISPTTAQTTSRTFPNCASADSDSDGDGYGFENEQSCIVVGGQAQQAETGQCIDSDGDGFGWNGFETCDPSSAADIADQSFQCIDSDGDGFGWNGFETCDPLDGSVNQPPARQCVDTDGDGYGWNGFETCDPSISSAVSFSITFPSGDTFPDRAPAQSQPYPVALQDFTDQRWVCLDYRSNGRPEANSHENWTFNANGSGSRDMQFSQTLDLFSWVWTSEGTLITWLEPDLVSEPPFFFFINKLPESSYWVRQVSPGLDTLSLVTRSGPFEGGLGCSLDDSLR